MPNLEKKKGGAGVASTTSNISMKHLGDTFHQMSAGANRGHLFLQQITDVISSSTNPAKAVIIDIEPNVSVLPENSGTWPDKAIIKPLRTASKCND